MLLNGQKLRGVGENYSFSSQFFGQKMQKINAFEEKWLLSAFFIKLKCRRLGTGLAI